MRAAWLLSAAAASMLAAGCGPRWPTVAAVYHHEFAADPGRVATVDLLPADVDVAVDDAIEADASLVTESINHAVFREVLDAVQRRGYRARWLDWSGRFHDADGSGVAMDSKVLRDTADSLHSYGQAQLEATRDGWRGTLIPHLPARLGDETGSDATLYVGGRAFVGEPPKHAGDDAGKVILVVAMVAVIAIAIVAIAAAGDDDGFLGKGEKKRNKKTSAARRRRSGGRLAAVARSTRDHRTRSSRARRRSQRSSPHRASRGSRDLADVVFDWDWHERPVDAHGRPHTHIQYVAPRAPREIEVTRYAWVELEMTLVSNDTGMVQWHARQRFDIDPQNGEHLAKAVRLMMKTMPRRARPIAKAH